MFKDIQAAIVKDRYAYFKDFLDNFYKVDKFAPDRISEQRGRQASMSPQAPRRMRAMPASIPG